MENEINPTKVIKTTNMRTETSKNVTSCTTSPCLKHIARELTTADKESLFRRVAYLEQMTLNMASFATRRNFQAFQVLQRFDIQCDYRWLVNSIQWSLLGNVEFQFSILFVLLLSVLNRMKDWAFACCQPEHWQPRSYTIEEEERVRERITLTV